MSDTAPEKKHYELLLLVAPDMAEKEFEGVLKEIKKSVEEDGKVTFEDLWGLRKLAFRIKKFDDAYYAALYFEADASAIAEVRTNVKLHPKILRHLLITLPEGYKPRAMQALELSAEQPKRERAKAAAPAAKKRGISRRPEDEERPPETKQAVAEIMGEQPEEKLKSVEKKLENILENPDIELK